MSQDTKTLLEINNGSEAAFSAIMKKYYPALYRYGLRFTKDEPLIMDCIQDVFIQFWQNRHNATSIKYPRQYLLTALKRRVLRVLSENKKKNYLPEEQSREYDFFLEFSVEELIVEKQLAQEKADKLKQILERLPNRKKEVIYLLYYQKLEHCQVAEIMQINRQTVYNLVSESIRKLKSFWQEAALVSLIILICKFAIDCINC